MRFHNLDNSSWLEAGVDVRNLLQLFFKTYPHSLMCEVLKSQPYKYLPFVNRKLANKFNLPLQNKRTSLRFQYPFLGDDNCPDEMKILVADKITAYTAASRAHDSLCSCLTLEDCYKAASLVVSNFIANYEIKRELDYYAEHSVVLGKHKIFAQTERRKELSNMPLSGLVERQKQVEDNVWRIKYELSKGDKPHLSDKRQERLKHYESCLADIKSVILKYQ